MSRTTAFALTFLVLVLTYPAGPAHAEESKWKEIKENHVAWDAVIEKGEHDVTYNTSTDALVYRIEFEQDVALERLVRVMVTTYDFQPTIRFRFGSKTATATLLKRVRSSDENVQWEYLYDVQLVTKRVGKGSIELSTDQIDYGVAAFSFYEYGSEQEVVPSDLVGTWTLDVERTATQLALLNGFGKKDALRIAKRFAQSAKGSATIVLKESGRLTILEGRKKHNGTWRYAKKQLVMTDASGSAPGYVSRDGSRIHLQPKSSKITVELVYKKS